MLFEDFLNIMKTTGIGYLEFEYNGKTYSTGVSLNYVDLYYYIEEKDGMTFINHNFDRLVNADVFRDRSLREIWDEIKIIEIDGDSLEDYDPNRHFDHHAWKKEQGNRVWTYGESKGIAIFDMLKYLLLVSALIPLISIIFPLVKLASWSLLYITGGVGLLTLIVGTIIICIKATEKLYILTDKKIISVDSAYGEVPYTDIEGVELLKINKETGYGTVKWLDVRCEPADVFIFKNIPDAQLVYDTILKYSTESKKLD